LSQARVGDTCVRFCQRSALALRLSPTRYGWYCWISARKALRHRAQLFQFKPPRSEHSEGQRTSSLAKKPLRRNSTFSTASYQSWFRLRSLASIAPALITRAAWPERKKCVQVAVDKGVIGSALIDFELSFGQQGSATREGNCKKSMDCSL